MHSAFLLLTGWAVLLGISQTESAPLCQARLETSINNNMLEVSGKCRSLAKSAAHYRYEMSLERHTSGGRSTSQQGGEFDLAAGQTVTLSSIKVNLDAQSAYVGQLRIFDAHNVLLAQDSIRHEANSR